MQRVQCTPVGLCIHKPYEQDELVPVKRLRNSPTLAHLRSVSGNHLRGSHGYGVQGDASSFHRYHH